ncbi:MAG: type II toxin-antitoxin system VapC family toxin [Candidatus Undinarchaeales archaeon]|jgi:predicted nucleic acid-binding protein|nr:type II toxin-antitoxin system VapC family toxin [Candidatus Undinarchaeales archaeon]MDP7492282.1 type II toxin-antitoxin system VapC family toxin [Candidatus Undinarchaeales archaeon]
MKLVLDSSVLAKLFIEESGTEDALALIGLAHMLDLELLAAQLAVSEVGNVLWKHLRDTDDDGSEHMRQLFLLDITFVPLDSVRSSRASSLATGHDISFYDAVHVALAEEHLCDLVTEDNELQKKVDQAIGLRKARELVESPAFAP